MNSNSRRGLRTSFYMQGASLSTQKGLSIKASSATTASQVSQRAIPDEIIRQLTEWPSSVKQKITRMTALSFLTRRCETVGERLACCNNKSFTISENLVHPPRSLQSHPQAKAVTRRIPKWLPYCAEWRISETLQNIKSKNFKFLNKGAVGAYGAHKLIMRKCSSPLGVNID